MHSNLDTRLDRYSIELRERLLWDIRDGIIGSEKFVPKHALIVTWKNMTFAGGLENTLKRVHFLISLGVSFLFSLFDLSPDKYVPNRHSN